VSNEQFAISDEQLPGYSPLTLEDKKLIDEKD